MSHFQALFVRLCNYIPQKMRNLTQMHYVKQTCSSSLMAAMLFWNLSRLQNVEIPSFVFWTRTCRRPSCPGFSASELSCLQIKELKLSLYLDRKYLFNNEGFKKMMMTCGLFQSHQRSIIRFM